MPKRGSQNFDTDMFESDGSSRSLFEGGGQSSSGLFGDGGQSSSGLFGGGGQSSGGLFGGGGQSSSGLFGGGGQSSSGLFGGGGQSSNGLFGGGGQPSSGLFRGGGHSSSGLFGDGGQPSSGSLFRSGGQPSSGSLFRSRGQSSSGNLFGGGGQSCSGSLFGGGGQSSSGGVVHSGGCTFGSRGQSSHVLLVPGSVHPTVGTESPEESNPEELQQRLNIIDSLLNEQKPMLEVLDVEIRNKDAALGKLKAKRYEIYRSIVEMESLSADVRKRLSEIMATRTAEAPRSSQNGASNITSICSICLDKHFDRALNCGHVFCGDCIAKLKERKCPNCREQIRHIITLYLS